MILYLVLFSTSSCSSSSPHITYLSFSSFFFAIFSFTISLTTFFILKASNISNVKNTYKDIRSHDHSSRSDSHHTAYTSNGFGDVHGVKGACCQTHVRSTLSQGRRRRGGRRIGVQLFEVLVERPFINLATFSKWRSPFCCIRTTKLFSLVFCVLLEEVDSISTPVTRWNRTPLITPFSTTLQKVRMSVCYMIFS